MLEGYTIINRVVVHDLGIDWTNFDGIATTYKEALEIFAKAKESLMQSMLDYNKTIIRDEEDVFCTQYNDLMYRYIKIINVY